LKMCTPLFLNSLRTVVLPMPKFPVRAIESIEDYNRLGQESVGN
jgi:hypothetical protein